MLDAPATTQPLVVVTCAADPGCVFKLRTTRTLAEQLAGEWCCRLHRDHVVPRPLPVPARRSSSEEAQR